MKKDSPNEKCTVMTKDEVRQFDARAIHTLGIPSVVLMENAGRGCAEVIREKLKDIARPKVCIVCGTGNNGGDGYVIARHLMNEGFEVTVAVCGQTGKIKGDAKINLDILQRMGRSIERLNPADADLPEQVRSLSAGADLLVDGLFGTGLGGSLSDEYKRLIGAINACDCPILAVDIPSGLDCDSGEPLGASVKANWTVTFVAVKKGFTSARAAQYTGEIFVVSIGIDPG
jgi:NAD(P)H-hydrate epimerase